MSGRYGGRTSEHAGARDFSGGSRLRDGQQMKYGTGHIKRVSGDKYHVTEDGKRIKTFDCLADAKQYVMDRALRGGKI